MQINSVQLYQKDSTIEIFRDLQGLTDPKICLFKVNNMNARDVRNVLKVNKDSEVHDVVWVSLLLTLNIFDTFF